VIQFTIIDYRRSIRKRTGQLTGPVFSNDHQCKTNTAAKNYIRLQATFLVLIFNNFFRRLPSLLSVVVTLELMRILLFFKKATSLMLRVTCFIRTWRGLGALREKKKNDNKQTGFATSVLRSNNRKV
jgi:hypothetical protein